jgi:uncharacterized protein YcgL (UPF0745 family)
MPDTTTCYIYRSSKKDELYLFIAEEDDFECVPEEVMKAFGAPKKAMELELTPETKMARSKPAEIIANLKERGFHLQMPPPTHELVEQILSREGQKQ